MTIAKQIKHKIILIIFIGFITSCNDCQENKVLKEKSINTTDRPISELIDLALEKGDTNAYNTLVFAYLDYRPGEFIPIALKMANKYEYPQAYFDLYTAILDYNGVFSPDESLAKMDEKSRELAIEYLILGAQKEHYQSLETLNDYLILSNKNKELIFSDKIKHTYGNYLETITNKK